MVSYKTKGGRMPKKITISLPDYIVSDLKEIAKQQGVTQTSVIATALYNEYKRLDRPKQTHRVAYKKAPTKSARKG